LNIISLVISLCEDENPTERFSQSFPDLNNELRCAMRESANRRSIQPATWARVDEAFNRYCDTADVEPSVRYLFTPLLESLERGTLYLPN
jgi:hypothetical protein